MGVGVDKLHGDLDAQIHTVCAANVARWLMHANQPEGLYAVACHLLSRRPDLEDAVQAELRRAEKPT